MFAVLWVIDVEGEESLARLVALRTDVFRHPILIEALAFRSHPALELHRFQNTEHPQTYVPGRQRYRGRGS